MTSSDKRRAALAALLAISVSSVPAFAAPAGQPASKSLLRAIPLATSGYLSADGGRSTLGKSQVEQVGEGSGDDTELLDQGAPPPTGAETQAPSSSAATSGEDVELLDQGAPPAVATAPAPVETMAAPPPPASAPAPSSDAAPATTLSAAAPASGPALPRGFGTGRVHVSTGSGAFPPGLENCHVGAVTGRAYVGIDCGDDGTGNDSFVGHAPTFNDFPFVVDPGFPFNRESSVFTGGGDSGNSTGVFGSGKKATGNGDVRVNAPSGSGNQGPRKSGTSDSSGTSGSETTSSGGGSVEMAQPAKNRRPRVRVTGGATVEAERHRNGRQGVQASSSKQQGAKKGGKKSHGSKGQSRDHHNGKAARSESKTKKQKAREKQRETQRESANDEGTAPGS